MGATMRDILTQTLCKIPHYLVASVLMSCAVVLLKSHGLTTGGFPGISIISSRVWDMSVGTILTAINIPFLMLAYTIKGRVYVVRTIVCIALFAVTADIFVAVFMHSIPLMNMPFVAMISGALSGAGVMYFMMHGGNSGGAMIAIQLVSERFNIPIAYVTFAFDGLVLLWGLCVTLSVMETLHSVLTILCFALTTYAFKSFVRKME